MEIPVFVRPLKSKILSSTSFQMGKTFWGVVSAAVEQSRRRANMVAQGDGKIGPWGWPQDPSKQIKYLLWSGEFCLDPLKCKAYMIAQKYGPGSAPKIPLSHKLYAIYLLGKQHHLKWRIWSKTTWGWISWFSRPANPHQWLEWWSGAWR